MGSREPGENRARGVLASGSRLLCYTVGLFPQVWRAGEWFLRSGIQVPNGGVARYYRSDLQRNHAVSTEITGYAASALVFLERHDQARSAARFLANVWHPAAAMPFEVDPAQFTYFFDCGIVARGLLSVWRATGDDDFLKCARAIGDSMARDFRAPDGGFYPILALPGKGPVERDAARWSRSPGCYQLKAGLAWWELWEATGESSYREHYCHLRDAALHTEADFLPGHADLRKVVDRLHAYLYFLEGLLPIPCAVLADGIGRVAGLVRELAPGFERSDVYAQLLRVRLFADSAGVAKLDRNAAQSEVECLLEFAAVSDDPRIDGGFYFGRSAGQWEPYVSPVSTAFALQALAMWSGGAPPNRRMLI